MLHPRRRHQLTVEEVDGVALVRPLHTRILDSLTIAEIGRELSQLVGRGGYCRLVVDLGKVEHLSSAFLAALLQLQQQLRTTGGALAICRPPPEVAEALALTGLDRILEAYDSVQQALEAFAEVRR
jgi:anti-anti-sigma factor